MANYRGQYQNQRIYDHGQMLHWFGIENKNRECYICDDGLFHRHWETRRGQEMILEQGDNKRMYCYGCCKRHKIDEGPRAKLLLSSSTLHNIESNPLVQNEEHVESITICGAKVDLITKRFIQRYKWVAKPLDIALVAGLNNIRKSSEGEFKADLLDLQQAVRDHSSRFNTDDSLTISTIPKAPQLCNLGIPRRRNFVDFTQKTLAFNRIIRATNIGGNLAKFTNELENFAALNGREYVPRNWREKNIDKKLHFSEELRIAAYKQVVEKLIQL